MTGLSLRFQVAGYMKLVIRELACKNSRFSLLFVAWDVLLGGTSVTQRQKFHADDVNACLHNKSGSPSVPNTN